MPVELQTTGQRNPLAYAEVSSGTGASSAEPQQQPSPADFSPEARAALQRLTGSSASESRALPSTQALPPNAAPNARPPVASAPAEVEDSDSGREIAKNLTIAAHSLGGSTDETHLYGSVFSAQGVAFDIPMVSGDAAVGTQRSVRLDLRNVVMPDGREVARGSGRVNLVIRNGRVTGMVEGSLTYDVSTSYKSGGAGTALGGHRGEPGRVVSGAALVRDGRVMGLAANSVIDIDGVRISSGDDDVDYRFTPPDLYTLGAGATVLTTPTDRTIRVTGADVSIVQGNVTTRLREGAIARIAPRAAVAVEGESERFRELPCPPPTADHAKELAKGNLVLRRIPGAQLYIDGIKSSALDQIGAGDCYLIGPVISTAEMQKKMIERLITDNHDGTYTVHFTGDNGPVDITVDDRFYMTAHVGDRAWYREKTGDIAQYSNSLTQMVYAANPAQPREIWGAIIEKAYAQWKGGYGVIYGGYPDIAMREITGRLSETTTHSSSNADAVFAGLQRSVTNRWPTFATTDQRATPETQRDVDAAFRRDYGMRNNHVYAVIDTVVDKGTRFVILRNTERLIEGRSSEYDADVDRDGDGRPDGQDGYFRLRYDDYFKRFAMTTTTDPSRLFVPGTKQAPYASHPIGQR